MGDDLSRWTDRDPEDPVSESTPCPTCGTPLHPGARFCGTCGATAPDPPADAPAGEPTTPTTAFGTGDPAAPEVSSPGGAPSSPTAVGGVGPIGGPAEGQAPGGVPPIVTPPTTAQPVTGAEPTMAEQAVAAAGAPPGGPPTGGHVEERPHWMPDPATESKSSRTGLFILIGVAGGVLVTLIALVALLTLGGDDEQVSSRDTTSTSGEPNNTASTQGTTTTTEATTTTSDAPTTTTSQAPSVPASSELTVGTCVAEDLVAPTGPIESFTPVDCDQPHRAELFAVFNLPNGPYPSNAERSSFTVERCQGSPFESYVGREYSTSQVYVTGVFADEAAWNGGTRLIQCFAHERGGEPTTGSYQNTNR